MSIRRTATWVAFMMLALLPATAQGARAELRSGVVTVTSSQPKAKQSRLALTPQITKQRSRRYYSVSALLTAPRGYQLTAASIDAIELRNCWRHAGAWLCLRLKPVRQDSSILADGGALGFVGSTSTYLMADVRRALRPGHQLRTTIRYSYRMKSYTPDDSCGYPSAAFPSCDSFKAPPPENPA